MTQVVVQRPARVVVPVTPTGPVGVVTPPKKQELQGGSAGWLQYLFPVVGSGGALVFVLINPQPLFIISGLVFALASVGMGAGLFLQQRISVRQRTEADRVRYLSYLERLRGDLRETIRRQRETAAWNHPEPDALWTLVRARTRLWERRPADPDFLELRVGVGRGPIATPLTVDLENDPLAVYDPVSVGSTQRLLAAHAVLEDLPLTIRLAQARVVSIVGCTAAVRGVARALIAQLAAFHSPEEAQLVVCPSAGAGPEWEWVKWLPHLHAPVSQGGHPESDDEDPAVNRLIEAELERRRREAARLREQGQDERDLPDPHLVVVVEGSLPSAQVLRLLEGRDGASVTLIVLVGRREDEPATVDIRLQVDDDGRLRIERGDASAESQPAADHADQPGAGVAMTLARSMAPLRPALETGPRLLRDLVSLPELLGIADVASLDPDQAWRPRPIHDRLRVPIGVDIEGDPVVLDLKESAAGGHGPHGLAVGATGSGKSELLRSLVVGLAATHPPELLSFVLVDFKGGAAFAGLADLPHVGGMITNLADDMALVDRMYEALFGELHRRQEILKRAGNLASIQEYHQRAAAGEALEPLPYLVLIVDEFSELLASRSDFINLFVAIGRLGRSLGMHLLLSSQQLDEGRLRGLEGHLSYRIALRTFSTTESRTLLGIPDAYHLPPIPGSAYLKVGTAVSRRFRAAYVSGAYTTPQHREEAERTAVRPFTATWPTATSSNGREPEPEPDLGASVLSIAASRLRRAGERAHQVWLPPLESVVTLDAIVGPLVHHPQRGVTAAGWPGVSRLTIPLGVLDRPAEQRRDTLTGDFSGAGGHLALVGAPQTGKSTLLRTFIAAFALTHTPEEVQFYCIDFGGGGLTAMERLPHVGSLSGRHDPERVARTVTAMSLLLEERERRFREQGLESMSALRALRAAGQAPEEQFGDVFLCIDNWPAVRQEHEDLEAPVMDIASRGLGYGLHLVITANRWLDLRSALRDSIGGRLELRLNDPSDSAVDRRTAESLAGSVPGRGLTPDRLHFQTALPRIDGKLTTVGAQRALEELVTTVCEGWSGPAPPAIKVLPQSLTISELAALCPADQPGVPIGLSEIDLEPVWLDLGGGDPHCVVFGDGESGKTTLLATIIAGLTSRRTPEEAQILVVDYRRTLLGSVPPDHLLGYAGAAPAAVEQLAEVAQALERRLPRADLSIEALRRRSWWQGPDVYVVVDDYDLVVTATANPLTPLLDYLAQGRDLGLHVILARRSGGAARALYEPVLSRLREVSMAGILLSGDPQEGPLLGSHRGSPQPPGRGMLVRRRERPALVQIAWTPS